MKVCFAIPILILILCVFSFAQTNENAPCPAISVIGPAGIVEPGEVATFTIVVNSEISESYFYKWTVTGGDIIEENGGQKTSLGKSAEGKGKTIIKTLQPLEATGGALTATVEVKGLPDGCPNTSSEMMVIDIDYASIQTDEFSISPKKIDEVRLKNLAKEFQRSPISQVYVIEQFDEGTSTKTIEQKNRRTIDYLKSQGVGKENICLLNGFSNKNLTQFYITPSGATPPTCDSCESVELE